MQKRGMSMTIMSRSRQYGVVFDHWQMKEFLGSGSGGKSAVFKLSRADSAWGTSALKIISLIEEEGNIDSISAYRRNEYEQAKRECKESAEQEVRLMDTVHGNTNIVDYLDHKFVEWSDETGFGCDMLIRMELLEDLRSKLRSAYQYSEPEIRKIGKDICTALVLCHKKGILHRDIKPENIFVNSDGNFKLGDFGVSRILSTAPTAVASTVIGTPEYAAPEQFTGHHDKRVDIYSLGLVLYELSNGNRLPFASTGYARPVDVVRRQTGEPLPPPCNASPTLARIILKACAYNKEERYQTAEAFLSALENLSDVPSTAVKNPAVQEISPLPSANATQRACANELCSNATVPAESFVCHCTEKPVSPKKKTKSISKALIFTSVLLLVISLAAASIFSTQRASRKDVAAETVVESTSLPTSTYETAVAPVSQAQPDFLDTATAYAADGRYREAIGLLDKAWQESGDVRYYEAAAEYRFDFGLYNVSLVAAGGNNTLVVNSDGTVNASGRNHCGQLAANNWTDIVAVGVGEKHVVGLKSDGTVVAAGSNDTGRCNVSTWHNVKAIAVGVSHTVGLLNDGTLVATGYGESGQCDTEKLMQKAGDRRIVSVAAGYYHTLALLEDGTVIAHGSNQFGVCDVYSWNNIAAIYAGPTYSLALKTDGSIVAAGQYVAQWDLASMNNLDNLAAGTQCVFAISTNGSRTILPVNSKDSTNAESYENMDWWANVVAISAGTNHVVAVTEAGDVLCAGTNNYHQCDLNGATRIMLEQGKSSNNRKNAVQAGLIFYRNNDVAYHQIIGRDQNGCPVWSYSSNHYERQQCITVSEIGQDRDHYYFTEGGTIIALDVDTGNVLWKNTDFQGYAPRSCIGKDGRIYLSGLEGPAFFAVSAEGETLNRISSFEPHCGIPSSIEVEDDYIVITFSEACLQFHIRTGDYTYESHSM